MVYFNWLIFAILSQVTGQSGTIHLPVMVFQYQPREMLDNINSNRATPFSTLWVNSVSTLSTLEQRTSSVIHSSHCGSFRWEEPAAVWGYCTFTRIKTHNCSYIYACHPHYSGVLQAPITEKFGNAGGRVVVWKGQKRFLSVMTRQLAVMQNFVNTYCQ